MKVKRSLYFYYMEEIFNFKYAENMCFNKILIILYTKIVKKNIGDKNEKTNYTTNFRCTY